MRTSLYTVITSSNAGDIFLIIWYSPAQYDLNLYNLQIKNPDPFPNLELGHSLFEDLSICQLYLQNISN